MVIVFPPPQPRESGCRPGVILRIPALPEPARMAAQPVPRRRLCGLGAGVGLCLALVACGTAPSRQLARGAVGESTAGLRLLASFTPHRNSRPGIFLPIAFWN